MKFMKLGTKPDTFFTEDATRTIICDIPSDLTIRVNNVTYLLHKVPLVSKCGLLKGLCLDSNIISLELHDIPGGEDAFELCAKFCYAISINLSANNIVSSLCAANFLGMTEAIVKGNLVTKLETFFNSCILEGWKDSILALQSTTKLPDLYEIGGIIRRSLDSILEKILTPTTKVTWSFTYTRAGYERKRHHSVPKDWWTEDLADLDIELFKSIIMALRSMNTLPPQLIGEALHVYACHWLPETRKSRPPESSTSQVNESIERKRLILETVVNLIPPEQGSVSIGFLLRLLVVGTRLRISPLTKNELIRRSALQVAEASLKDMLLLTDYSCVDIFGAVFESFFRQYRTESVVSLQKVGKLVDEYLQVVARDLNIPVEKIVCLAEAVPQIARTNHDQLYTTISIYLKEHPNLNKEEKRKLCRILDCKKLSPEVRNHAVRNEQLPLRTVVQLLFYEQDKGTESRTHDDMNSDDQSSKTERVRPSTMPKSSSEGVYRHGKQPESSLQRIVKERRSSDPTKVEHIHSKGGRR